MYKRFLNYFSNIVKKQFNKKNLKKKNPDLSQAGNSCKSTIINILTISKFYHLHLRTMSVHEHHLLTH